MKANNITELIGNTPIVRINRMAKKGSATIWAKLESFNPGSSVKDRIGLSMIEAAEHAGKIKPGDTLIEPTSGNTGIGLAMAAAVKGYKLVLTMPSSLSQERRAILKAFGAELILIEPEEGPGMTGAIKHAERLVNEKGYLILQQFKNPANPEVHVKTTGPEIIESFPSGLDYFVSGVGTGGTVTGAGQVLREFFPRIKISAVEPASSPVLSGGKPAKHAIQGIGAGFIPEILNTKIYDEIIQVEDDDAKETTRRLAKEEGILAGISSGAAMFAAIKVAEGKGEDKNLVVILPDTGERYLSTDLFN